MIQISFLVLLLICHWAADFSHLSMPYMLQAKRIGRPIMPILHHALIHGTLMLSVMLLYSSDYMGIFGCFMFEVATHWGIDITKGKISDEWPKLADPSNPYHWYIFGLDQLLHVIVIIIMWVYLI